MVLPSQSGRPISRHSHMYRRKRGRRPLMTGVIVLAAAIVGAWLWFSKDDPSPAAASTGRDESSGHVSDRPTAAGIVSTDHRQPKEAGAPARESRVAMGEPVNGALLGRSTKSPPASDDSAEPARGGTNPGSNQSTPPASPVGDQAKPDQTSSKETAPSATATSPAAPPPPSTSRPKAPLPTSEAMDSPALKEREGLAGNAPPQGARSEGAGTPAGSARPAASTSTGESAAALSAVPLEEQNRARQLLQTGLNLQAENKPVEARRVLTQAYESHALAPADEVRARQALALVNDVLVFSPTIVNGDPFASVYVVQSGDTLQKIAKPCRVEWEFLARINRIGNPRALQFNQKLKTISGPFHAVVDKSSYRLDLYAGDGAQRVFVRSFSVGLGEYNSTPLGHFKVRPRSKLRDPAWTNPRTGEHFEPSDPRNPIGEYWIGLEGLDEHTQDLAGYGIHGTIELDSIGQQRSMGCVRMLSDDIALIYELLMPEVSTVEIRE